MPVFEQVRQWARTLKRDVLALYLAARDPRVPWYAKAVAACVAVYALRACLVNHAVDLAQRRTISRIIASCSSVSLVCTWRS